MNLPGVYTRCYNDVAIDVRLSNTSKVAYWIIKAHCIKKDRCWPSIETIATLMGMGRRQVERSINDLEKLGYLKREKRDGQPSRYIFTCDVRVAPPTTYKSHTYDSHVAGGATPVSYTYDVQVAQKHIKEANKKNHKNKRGEFQKPEIPVPPIKAPESNPKPRTRRQRHIPMTRDEVTVAISSFDLTEFKKKYPTLDIDSVLEDFSDWALWKNDPNSGRPNYEKWSSWNVAFNNWCRREKNSGGNGSRPTLRKGPNPADNPGYEDMFR